MTQIALAMAILGAKSLGCPTRRLESTGHRAFKVATWAKSIGSGQPRLIGIVRGLAAVRLGSRILRIPWLASAWALSKSTSLGSVIWR